MFHDAFEDSFLRIHLAQLVDLMNLRNQGIHNLVNNMLLYEFQNLGSWSMSSIFPTIRYRIRSLPAVSFASLILLSLLLALLFSFF